MSIGSVSGRHDAFFLPDCAFKQFSITNYEKSIYCARGLMFASIATLLCSFCADSTEPLHDWGGREEFKHVFG